MTRVHRRTTGQLIENREPGFRQGIARAIGESFVNLNPSTLVLQDFYTPSKTAAWTTADLDISAGGITVLPDGVGPTAHPNVLVGTDKQGHLWMMDRNRMSGFLPNAGRRSFSN